MTLPAGFSYREYAPGEWLLAIGDTAASSTVLLIPPLLEEMNRTRALMVAVMRALADRGHLCLLPDLPGTGESGRDLSDISWAEWQAALAGIVAGLRAPPTILAIRGGALLDDMPAAARYRLAPVDGGSLLRDLERAALTGAGGGYHLSDAMTSSLRAAILATPTPLRIARLASDPKPADVHLDGPALWRRSEPGNAPTLAAAVAADTDQWIRTCAG